MTLRLNKYLAECGVSSRRRADVLIVSGIVTVNGRVVAELGTRIDPRTDEVSVSGKSVGKDEKGIYIILNKPKDCITSTKDERGRKTVLDLVRVAQRVYPVGRLDRDTTGAIILTNDGGMANRLMHPRYNVKKVYRARLDKPISRRDAQSLSNGILLDDGLTSECEVFVQTVDGASEVEIAVHEGRKREVRRMFEKLGYKVEGLARVSYAGLTTKGLRRSEWRYLTKQEIHELKKVVGLV